jgi:oligopeptide transport system substrate-binding protein
MLEAGKRMKRLLPLVACLLAVCVLGATLLLGQPGPQKTVPSQEVTINALQGEPDSIDPTLSGFNTEAAVVRQVFEPLLRLDAHLQPQPAAAQSYSVSDDGRVWTFNLRADGRWSDGQPVRAADFAYAFNRLLNPATTADYGDAFKDAGITEVRAVDDLTLQIVLEAPFGPLSDLVALWVASPVRQDVVEQYGDDWARQPATYIGNGPYKLSEWQHQDHMTFVPNVYYHGPAPSLNKLTFLMVGDEATDFAAYLNGERDWALVPAADVQRVRSDSRLAAEAHPFTELNTSWLRVNTSQAPLNDPLVRQALSRAIDREALVRDAESGLGGPASSIIPPGMPGYQADLGAEIRYDPAAAAELLRQAGYADASQFPTLTYSFGTTPANQRRAEFIQSQLQHNLGISVQLEALEPKAFQAAVRAGRYQLAFGGWSADYPDPQNWFSSNFGCGSALNSGGYCNTEFDDLVSQADSSTDAAGRLKLYAQAQSMLVHDLPVIPLVYRGGVTLVRPAIQNLTITSSDDYPGDLFLDRVSIADPQR